MKKQITFILLLASACVLVACGNKETDKKKDEMVQVEQSESDVTEESFSLQLDTLAEEPSQQNGDEGATEEAPTPSTGNNNTTTKPSTGSTTKPSTGSTGNSGSTNNSGNTGSTTNNNTNSGTTTKPSAPVHEHNWVEVTEEEIHYYDWRNVCFVCGKDLSDMSSDDILVHVVSVCGGNYGVKFVEVDYVTENVVKTPVVTGYKCECGATKK